MRPTVPVLRRALLSVTVAMGALAAPATAAQDRSDARIPGQWIVVYEATVDSPGWNTNRLERSAGFRSRARYGQAVKGFAARLGDRQVAALRRDPKVAFVSPDRRVTAAGEVALMTGDSAPAGVRRMRAATATTAREAASGDVAVLDTGIDLGHPDLAAVAGTNCVGSGPPADDHGHGTHVAGSIGARNDGAGVVGTAPGTRVLAVKVLDSAGSGSWSQVICGIDWVTATRTDADPGNDVAVANMSLGGPGAPVKTCATTTDALHAAICGSTAAGVTYVVAAGNDGWDFDYAPNPDTPAAYPEVLTVTAMSDSDGAGGATGGAPTCRSGEADDRYASFSNYAKTSAGQVHTIAGPGVCVRSTARGGGHVTMSGTSMATPHVAGAVARCIGEAGSPGPCAGMTPAQVISRARADADAATRADLTFGFTGDPLHSPVSGRYYGFLYPGGPEGVAPPPPADTTKPTAGTVTPGAGATGVATTTAVTVAFSEPMDQAAAQAAFALRPGGTGSPVPGSFSWSGTTMTFRPSAALAAGTSHTATVTTAATDLAGNPLSAQKQWSFTTAAPSAAGTFAPSAVDLLTGTAAGGDVSSLGADDNQFYAVDSTPTGTRTTSWVGRVDGVSNALKSLKIAYRGKNSYACSQTLALFNWSTAKWVQVYSGGIGATEKLITKSVGGTLANYVSGTSGPGELHVRVACTSTSKAFTSSADLLTATTT